MVAIHMENPMHSSPTPDAEVPFVCQSCTRVFRARLSELHGTRLQCGACGTRRSGDALLRLLPAAMRRAARGMA